MDKIVDSGDDDDDDLPSIVFEDVIGTRGKAKETKNTTDQIVTDTSLQAKIVTDTQKSKFVTDTTECTWINEAENDTSATDYSIPNISNEVEVIEICSSTSKDFEISSQNMMEQENGKAKLQELLLDLEEIPEDLLWTSILTAFASCTDYDQLEKIVLDVKDRIPALNPRNEEAKFWNMRDIIDCVAQMEIPPDGPRHLRAIQTLGDGNCLCQALSRAFFGDESHHAEIRAQIVIEGIVNRQKYLSDHCLERGASFIHKNADLPTVFTTFSIFTRLAKESQRTQFLQFTV